MAKRGSKKDSKNLNKRHYSPPKLVEYGSVRDLTKTTSTGNAMDGGALPRNMRTCIASVGAIEEHRILIADRNCQKLFRDAIFEVVRPGDVVLDLGTGSGIHALFACQAGAKKVYAIESEGVIEIAREVVIENGFANKVEFIFGKSSEVTLPEKVDVIITNTGFLGTLEFLAAAKKRFLKKGGRTIPQSMDLYCAPVLQSTIHEERIGVWNEKAFGLSFASFKRFAVNSPHGHHFSPTDFMSKAKKFGTIDLKEPAPGPYQWNLKFQAGKSGRLCGFAVWYSFRLSDSVVMSTEPLSLLAPELWRQTYLGLESPISLRKGEAINLNLQFFPQLSTDYPIWSWAIKEKDEGRKQNIFHSFPIAVDLLKERNRKST